MTTQRLHRIAEHRRKMKANQARAEQLRAQADDLILHLRGTCVAASRDGDKIGLSFADKRHGTTQATAGLIATGVGTAIWWDGNIPLLNIAPSAQLIAFLISVGILITTNGYLSSDRTYSLSVRTDDPVVTRLLEHSETISWLRSCKPEPARYDMITREKRRLERAIISHPNTELRRAPSLLTRTITLLRGLRR